ncbi:MAG: ATP-dependent DNA helicase RecG [Bacilli bacterium]|nr:ATP-dependent DNA helicase RecG [Bacilli bacterium]
MSDLLEIKGIGKSMEAKLFHEGITSISELVETFPSRYESRRIQKLIEAKLQEEITLSGIAKSEASVYYIRRKLTKLTFEFGIDSTVFKVSIFNREFMKASISVGKELVITGKFINDFRNFTASDIVTKPKYIEGIVPIYRTDTMSSKQFHKLIMAALSLNKNRLSENLPLFLLERQELVNRVELFDFVHQPHDEKEVLSAQERVKYEELLNFALRIAALKKLNSRIVKKQKNYDIGKVRAFIDGLPFELTKDQKEATNEIFRDFKSKNPMNRLLQGDVGSGKTICAVIAALAVVTAGQQVAYMAPTEILAHQHFQTFCKYLSQIGVQIEYLSGSVIEKARKDIYSRLEQGNIDIIIGTHALIQEDLAFRDLGFIVIDEQHRFGVKQRQFLRKKGITPDVLFMSATPIPRTLAITLFGDLDISSIHTIPAGRKAVLTKIVGYDDLDSVFVKTIEEIQSGHQAYFTLPLIVESEASSLISVEEFLPLVREKLGRDIKIEMLHGKLNAKEKTEILEAFYKNEVNVLVATTVVEVGMNVPNATVMTVLNASRFGLSQLHQLRGRVGRDNVQAYCFYVVDDPLRDRGKLEVLERTVDGFEISETDLEQRGPGEVFGEEQTGIPKFRMANIVTDKELLEQALNDAKDVLAGHDELSIKLVNRTFALIDAYNLD